MLVNLFNLEMPELNPVEKAIGEKFVSREKEIGLKAKIRATTIFWADAILLPSCHLSPHVSEGLCLRP